MKKILLSFFLPLVFTSTTYAEKAILLDARYLDPSYSVEVKCGRGNQSIRVYGGSGNGRLCPKHFNTLVLIRGKFHSDDGSETATIKRSEEAALIYKNNHTCAESPYDDDRLTVLRIKLIGGGHIFGRPNITFDAYCSYCEDHDGCSDYGFTF